MNQYEQKYMPSIRANQAERERLAAERSRARKKMGLYEDAVSAAVAKLQEEYGYEDISNALSTAESRMSELDDAIRRDGIFLVIRVACAMFRANEREAKASAEGLQSNWGIEVSRNYNVNDGNFVACFTAFTERVCSDAWWSENRPEAQSNGMTWVTVPAEYEWSPVVGIGIPHSVLCGLDQFLAMSEDALRDTSERWAKSWMDDTADDTEKQMAVYEALRARFDKAK